MKTKRLTVSKRTVKMSLDYGYGNDFYIPIEKISDAIVDEEEEDWEELFVYDLGLLLETYDYTPSPRLKRKLSESDEALLRKEFYVVEAVVNSIDYDVGDALNLSHVCELVANGEYTVRFVKPGRS